MDIKRIIKHLSGLLLGATVAVAASPVQAADNYILGRCSVSSPTSGVEVRPTISGNSYLVKYHGGDSRYQGFTFDDDSVKVTLIKAPAHGKVEHVSSTISPNWYHYMPHEAYFGQDRFVMQVEKEGIQVRIEYLMETVPVDEPTSYLCNPDMWKVSSSATTSADNGEFLPTSNSREWVVKESFEVASLDASLRGEW